MHVMRLHIFSATSQCQWSLEEFLAEQPAFHRIFEPSRGLSVVPSPDVQTGTRCAGNDRRFVDVPILLAFISQCQSHLCDPSSDGGVRLRAFLLEAAATADE